MGIVDRHHYDFNCNHRKKREMELKPYIRIFVFVFLMASIALIIKNTLNLDSFPNRALEPPGAGSRIGVSPNGVDLLNLLSDASIRAVWTAVSTALLTVILGAVVGIFSAETRDGWFDRLQAMLGNVLDSIGPFVFAACVLAVASRLSHLGLEFVVALASWPPVAVMIRKEILRTKSMAYYEAALCLGLGPTKLFLRHILPNVVDRVIPFSLAMATGFLGLYGALDFIGAGQSSKPQLGSIIYDSLNYLESASWYFTATTFAFALVLLVLGMSSQLMHRFLRGTSV